MSVGVGLHCGYPGLRWRCPRVETACAILGAGFWLVGSGNLGGFKLFHFLGQRPKRPVKLHVLPYTVDGAGPGVAVVGGAA